MCTLAFWHHPRFQAGTVSGEASAAAPLWDALFDAGVDVVLNGHEHGYQQLAPLNKAGELDPVHGIRTFIVGTGGGGLYQTDYLHKWEKTHRDVYNHGSFGILRIELFSTRYRWSFVPIQGDPDISLQVDGVMINNDTCNQRQ